MKKSEEKHHVNLGSVEKIPLGQGHCFIVDQKEIAVFRLRSGDLCAVQNRCPHRRGPLCDGVIDERQVVCPYHGHKFDLRSGLGSEASERIKIYEVGVEQGEIFLKL